METKQETKPFPAQHGRFAGKSHGQQGNERHTRPQETKTPGKYHVCHRTASTLTPFLLGNFFGLVIERSRNVV